MALVTSLAALLATALFAFLATLLGHRVLRRLGAELHSHVEHLLLCSAVGVVLIETLLFFVQFSNHIRMGTIVVVGLVFLAGLRDIRSVLGKISGVVRKVLSGARSELTMAAIVTVIVLLEGLTAMAPVTGSDALHYHFTTPALILRDGFHPDFFLAHSFFTGQGHLLILAGLALGSSQLAMGFLFLGGVLSAAAAACVARQWASREWAWVAALTFLVTPVVFWQISTAGAPDIWMAFFATTGVLVISKSKELPPVSGAILAGALAGAVAGTKYTGCIIAATMAAAYVWEARLTVRTVLFLGSSLAAGIYPYARNLAWTGDPVFPFFTRWISPGRVNTFALASLLADTGAVGHRSFWQIVKFPFFAGIDAAHLGFWQFLGPLVLAFAPLSILAVRNTPPWRAVLTVWVLGALGIAASSGMVRFLLPVLPIALAASIAGVQHAVATRWRAAHFVAIATLAGFLLLGGVGFLAYGRSALSVAVGRTSREDYLRQRVQEYGAVEFLNQRLGSKEGHGVAVVFIRHLFYLEVPFLNCDPSSSWAIDPDKLQTADEWLAFFRRHDVRWVVRSRDYPEAIDAPLRRLELNGDLEKIAETQVVDFQGLRIAGERESVPLAVLELRR